MDIDLPGKDVGEVTARQLVVLLHGFCAANTKMNSVAATIQKALPGADIYIPDLATAHLFCTTSAETITARLIAGIDCRMARRDCGSIILVGHSLGGLLARKTFLAAWGAAEDVVDEAGKPLARRKWAGKISRIVFMAAVNRGWTIASSISYLSGLQWRLGSLINNIAFGGGLTVFQSRRGARFLVETRLQWLRLAGDPHSAASQVKVVQLLGTLDDFVSPDDAVDHVADLSSWDVPDSGDPSGQRFFMLEFPHTGHKDAIELGAACPEPGNPELATIQAQRRSLLALAVSGVPAELSAHPRAVSRKFLEDTLLPAPDPDVQDVVFVIHGIRDRGFWTKKIARKIRENAGEDREVRCVTATYGYLPMAQFVVLWVRQEKVEWFMDLYCEARAQFPKAKFSYVGHSNGTYLLASALRNYPSTRFESVVFAGSVVRRDFPWERFLLISGDNPASRVTPTSRVTRVLNYVATNDRVVALFPKGLQPFKWFNLGSAGHDGFDAMAGSAQMRQSPTSREATAPVSRKASGTISRALCSTEHARHPMTRT
jgi:pimeloyl-ACP methyl ester carboxylesterase